MNIKNYFLENYNAYMLCGGSIVVALLLVPYASNGFWFDDALNSQIYFFLHKVNGDLGEFSYRVVNHWFQHEGRLMLGFFHGYAGFYLFNDLFLLRLAQCATVVINIALYGYMLWLLGATIRFLVAWAIILVGLLQIHGNGLDAVAGFAFHYQILGIQLAIVLIFFVKWRLNNNLKFLYFALISWLFFMMWYEINAIFIPIAFAILFINGDQYKKLPAFMLLFAACLYLALNYYLRSHAVGAYAGSAFGLPSNFGLAYLKQLTAAFPFVSYLAITHTALPFSEIINNAIHSTTAWSVLIFSLMVFVSLTSMKSPSREIRGEAFIISLGMFVLPAIFPAISLRYQNEVAWGAGTLPVYYQVFGLAFFAAWATLSIPKVGILRLGVPILISIYLALNVTINSSMVKSIEMAWREPREAFLVQARAGLFAHVEDGDIVHLKNLPHYINSNLIFQWSAKRVYVPTEDHSWYPEEVPNKFARGFDLSRDAAGRYQVVEIQSFNK